MPPDRKPIPAFGTDEAARRFVEDADLTEFDLSGFRPARFEFGPKDTQVLVKMSRQQRDAAQMMAERRGLNVSAYIRLLVQEDVEREQSGGQPRPA